MENTKYKWFGPWLFMVPMPFAFPLMVLVMMIMSIVNPQVRPFAKFHYWLASSIAGLFFYMALDYYLSYRLNQVING